MNNLEKTLNMLEEASDLIALVDTASGEDLDMIEEAQDLLLIAAGNLKDMLPEQTQDKE